MMGNTDSLRYVLLAEDDPDIRSTVADVLRGEGYYVTCAADGWQAIDLLREPQLPNVILLDLMMPVMAGWEFLTEIRNHARLASIPIVVLSAIPGTEHDARTLGVAAYLTKPIDIEVLLDTIRRQVEPEQALAN